MIGTLELNVHHPFRSSECWYAPVFVDTKVQFPENLSPTLRSKSALVILPTLMSTGDRCSSLSAATNKFAWCSLSPCLWLPPRCRDYLSPFLPFWLYRNQTSSISAIPLNLQSETPSTAERILCRQSNAVCWLIPTFLAISFNGLYGPPSAACNILTCHVSVSYAAPCRSLM